MPFFCRLLKPIKKQCVTLQVRILISITGRKKVSFSASAVLTLEAALVLPLFLFAGVILMTPFSMMDTHRQVQAAAERVSEQIGEAACLAKHGDSESFWNTAAAFAYGEGAVRSRLKGLPVSHISLKRSSLLEDGETIDLVIDYQMSLPFPVFRLGSVKQTVRSFRRAWVGAEGRWAQGGGQGAEEELVYVGKGSTRYHISSICHYLYNDLTAVSVGEIGSVRNQDGRRYSPCSRCQGSPAASVYIMPSGTHYHTTPSCSAIGAYTRAVPKREVEYLGPCSYCSGGR
ncbi:MAG: hypothetical protein HFG75_00050 [Hungatella sp.]|nr:hypothetical protein [Hungatella sp.]